MASRKERLDRLAEYASKLIQDNPDFDRQTIYHELEEHMMIEWGLSQNTRNDYVKSIAAILKEEFTKRDSETNAKTPTLDSGLLDTNIYNADPKMKIFWDVFKGLAGSGNNNVEDKALNSGLVKTGKFVGEEARKYIMRVYEERKIYLVKPGLWKKV
jgi:hypothetical protein